MLKLYIGNKNYSSWSMRPWVLMRQAGIEFEEIAVRFDSFADTSEFKRRIGSVSPVRKVPALDDDGFVVWDSLAICEYLAEHFPDGKLWPREPKLRARARSVCAEMHSGFSALRSACPMNIEADLTAVGQVIWRDQAGVRADVHRISVMWSELLALYGSGMSGSHDHFLFGHFTIADAFFAPVCMRLKSYGLPVPADVADYMGRIAAAPGVKAWIDGALAEKDFLDFEEPYRFKR
jgi:glutathione S-transferase